jgi:thermostable 8-oxoguanine DNA glycosylase
MIDPFNVTNFHRTEEELEEYLLFCVVVAGKTATTQTRLLDKFLYPYPHNCYDPFAYYSPLEKISYFALNGSLLWRLKLSKLGQYTRLFKVFSELSLATKIDNKLDLKICTVHDLEKFSGIGPKTSRFFILHSRPNVEHIVFDTHLSKWFYERGLVPFTATPSQKQYDIYEPICIQYLKEHEGVTDFAQFDIDKWTERTKTSA